MKEFSGILDISLANEEIYAVSGGNTIIYNLDGTKKADYNKEEFLLSPNSEFLLLMKSPGRQWKLRENRTGFIISSGECSK